MQGHVVPERRHAHGLVADPLERDPERRPDEVADQHVDDDRDDQADVVEALAVVDDVAHEPGRVAVDARDGREAADLGHLADEQERDHRVRQREHQEVDPEAPGGHGTEQNPDPHREQDRRHDGERRVPPEQEPLRLSPVGALGDHVPERVPCDAHQAGLRERDHPAERREEHEARGADAEDEGLREHGVHPEARDELRRKQREDERAGSDRTLDHRLPGVDVHAALPNSPCGRNARTSAISTNVSTGEYCVQQSAPDVGR